MATIEIGYDVRAYTRFEIQNPTREELDLLSAAEQMDYQHDAFVLLAAMHTAGRLTRVEDAYDPTPGYFERNADPNIVTLEED